MDVSISSLELEAIFESGDPEDVAVAKAITEELNPKGKPAFHRTDLWRYRTGRGKPSADSIALLERLTGGRVPANGWEDITAEAAAEWHAERARKAAAKLVDSTREVRNTPPEAPAPKRLSSPPALADATELDDEPTRRDVAIEGVKVSERDRVDTDKDPRAGEELAPTPKPLTVLDVPENKRSRRGRVPSPEQR